MPVLMKGLAKARGMSGVIWGLDAEAEVYVLLVAGVGVEVIGVRRLNLSPLAELAADEEAERDGSEAGGRVQPDSPEEGGFWLFGDVGRPRRPGMEGLLRPRVLRQRCVMCC